MDYYSTRSSYGLGGDDYLSSGPYVSSSSTRSRAMASTTLDDNDLISRRSRLADARALGNMSSTMDALSAPLPRPIPRPIAIRTPAYHHRSVHHAPIRTRQSQLAVNTGYIYPISRTPRVVHHENPVIYEVHRNRIEPLDLASAGESLNSLKRHVTNVKAGLGSQKMLLDRYLPIDMGAAQTVDQGINRKYYELAVRMPNLEPESYRKRSYLQDECAARPMNPHGMRSQSVPRQVGSSMSPMSDTRKNIRKLITRTRRDPGFYN